jgi:protein-disulfide isomerase
MASRKEQKEAARQRRIAEEQARAEKARRERRLRMLGGLVIGAVAVIAVVIAISSGGGGGGLQKGKNASKTVAAVTQLLNGIPQSGNVLGNPSAPVTMTYFGDLECPVCQAFTLGNEGGGWPQLITNDVRKGKVKVVYKAFQTATRDPTVFKTQQVAALAAGKQNKFWDYVELFYHEQGAEGTGYVTTSYLDGLASQVPGLNVSQWRSTLGDGSLATEVSTEMTSGTTQGVSGTPTLIFEGPHGKAQPQSAVPSYAELAADVKHVS